VKDKLTKTPSSDLMERMFKPGFLLPSLRSNAVYFNTRYTICCKINGRRIWAWKHREQPLEHFSFPE